MNSIFKVTILSVLLFSCSAVANKEENIGTEFNFEESSEGEPKNDFRDVKWGMAYDKVAATEVMLETFQELTNKNFIHFKTPIYAYGEKCYLIYQFRDEKLSGVELEFEMPEEYDNTTVIEGETFEKAFKRMRNVMKSIQSEFKYKNCEIVDEWGKIENVGLPVTDTDLFSIQNKLSALLVVPISPNRVPMTSSKFRVEFENKKSIASFSFIKRRAIKYKNDDRFYEWLIVRLNIMEK